MSTQNTEAVRRWVEEMWNERDRNMCHVLMAPGFVEHALAPFSEAEPGEKDGPCAMRETMDWLLGQFPDPTMTIEATVAQDDLVAVRVCTQGTNLGRLNGILPASGRHFTARPTHWSRLHEGRITEHWATRDDLTSMLQLGVVRRPGPSHSLSCPVPAATPHTLKASLRRQSGQCYGAASGVTVIALRGSRRHDRLWVR
jgi:predicted ester cyclase